MQQNIMHGNNIAENAKAWFSNILFTQKLGDTESKEACGVGWGLPNFREPISSGAPSASIPKSAIRVNYYAVCHFYN